MSKFSGMTRRELELTIIAGATQDTESAVLLLELREDDFQDEAARAGFKAVQGILAAHEHVDEVLVHRRLCEAKQGGYAQTLLDHVTNFECFALSVTTLTHYIEHLKDVSMRFRLKRACIEVMQLADDQECTKERIHEEAPIKIAEALARAIPNEATSARDVMLELAVDAQEAEEKGLPALPILDTGMAELDAHECGGCAGEIITLAAGPSMGKSAFALQVALEWCRSGPVYYWSGEMPKKQLARRIASQLSYVPRTSLTASVYSQQAGQDIANLYLDDEKGISVDRLIQKVTLYKMLNPGLKALVVDYLGLLCDNDYKSVSRASRMLKALAGKLNIPILELCQLKRDTQQDRPPQMNDLRDSGQIEQDADKVLMLYRPGFFDPNRDQTEALLYVRKYRDGERNVAIRFRWQGNIFRFFPPLPKRGRPEPELREPCIDNEYFPGFKDRVEMDNIPL